MKIAFSGSRSYRLEKFEHVMSNIDLDITHAIVGGAIGVYTFAAEYCIRNGIPYTLVLPFPEKIMSKYWNNNQRNVLYIIVNASEKLIVIQDHYSVSGYHKRNERMVDLCDELIAFPSGTSRGTVSTIRYAREQGKKATVYEMED